MTKRMVTNNIRSEKLRLGIWGTAGYIESQNLVLKKDTSKSEINHIRSKLENLNYIYYYICRKFIRKKTRMDWKNRNTNRIKI